jgi:hypothetical protein
MSFLDSLMQNESVMLIVAISTLVGMFFGFYMFAHHIYSHGMKANLIMYNQSPTMSMTTFNAIHKEFFKVIRKDYYKDYYSTIWMIIPTYVVSYVGGAILAYFVITNANIFQYQIIALAFSVLFALPLLPLIATLEEELYKKYAPKYNELGFKSVRDSFDELMKSKQLSDDQKKSLEEMMKLAEEKEKASKEDQNKDEKK